MLNLAKKYYNKIVQIRRNLHQCPEIAYCEYKTSEYIEKVLTEHHIPFQNKIAGTGIVGYIIGKQPGKTVLLRADMDCLPVMEQTGLPFASKNEGFMHACGHDAHVAGLLGCAMILNEIKDQFSGTVKLVFQPGEEDAGGAEPMIKEGVLENPHVDVCAALHVTPGIDVGKIEVKHGPLFASPDDFHIILHGVGGHGATPELCKNPIMAASEIIDSMHGELKTLLQTDIPYVLSFCSFEAGTCATVIPDTAVIKGTIRTVDPILRSKTENAMEQVIRNICKKHEITYEFKYIYFYPATINDNHTTDLLAASAAKVLKEENVVWRKEPKMIGEDFAYFAQNVPSSYFLLGCSNDDPATQNPLHSSNFNIDESCLLYGSSVMAQFAYDFLR